MHEALPNLRGYLPVYSVRLVRTDSLAISGLPKIQTPKDVAAIAWNYLEHCDREQVLTLLVDAKNGIIGIHSVSVGDLSSAIIHPREVFKAAILANSAGIVLAHNHPSGDPTPSPEDVTVTQRIHEAGKILDIALLDHVIVGGKEKFVSLKEKDYLYGIFAKP